MGMMQKITDAGFTLTLSDGAIEISPASKLTDIQRTIIREHKAEIIAEFTAANDQGITETERAYLAGWLSHIGETDPEMISEFWHNIRHKQGAKDYFLQRAMAEATPDYRRHCHECQHFTKHSRYCTKLKARQLDDIPRHCDEFKEQL